MQVMGVDVGGTSVRAVAVADGRVLGVGRAQGANFRSSGPLAVQHLRDAVQGALDEAGGVEIAAVAVGAAGAAAAGHAQMQRLLGEALHDLPLPTPMLSTDLDIAYRSAATSPDGTLLLAGTGAVAARFEGWELATRADGLGWLLGDEGSGVWIGREVLRAVAADVDRRGPRTTMTAAVLSALDIADADPRQPLIAATAPLTPASWARFAPLALEHRRDDVAAEILDRAADGLLRSARAVGIGGCMVLAGGLLEAGALRERLAMPNAVHADHPVAGACAMAAASLGAELDAGSVAAQLRVSARSR